MDAEQLKEDVRQGRFPVERLVDIIVTLQTQLDQARRRIEELERKVGGSATAKLDEPFSMRAEEQLRIRRRRMDGYLAVYASQRRLPDATQDSLPVVG